MKTLLKIIAIMLPMLMFSQQKDSAAAVIKLTAEKILKEKKSIDSLTQLKTREVERQVALLKQLRTKIDVLKKNKQINVSDDYALLSEAESLSAIKPENEAIYWEEVRRKWSGRVLTGAATKVRIFRFENGKKVYID